MQGAREPFVCGACHKTFTYWVLEGNPHPKVKCYYCAKELFPKGEPPAPLTPPPPAEKPAEAKAPAAS